MVTLHCPALRAALLLLVAASAAAFSPARATCGSAACFLVADSRETINPEGTLKVDLSFRYIDQSRKLSGRDDVAEVLTPKVSFEERKLEPDHHREIRTLNTQYEIDLSYGLSPKLTITGVLPLVNDRAHEHFDDVGTDEEHFTNSDGTRGFGDVQLGLRYSFISASKDLLVGGISLKTPTGEYRLRDSEGDINEPTIQPGTGSLDYLALLHYSHQIVPHTFDWFVSGSYRLNTENDLDYRFGEEVILSAGVSHSPGPKLNWSVQVNGRRTGRDRFLGDAIPSTGSTLVNLTPGLRVTGEGGFSLYGFLQLPVFQDVNEAQLAPRWGLLLGVSKIF